MCPSKHEAIDTDIVGEVTGKRFEPGTLQIQDLRSDVVPNSFEEAVALWETPIEVKSDWELVTDKRQLIGKPFLIQKVRFYEGNYGPAVAVMAITQDNRRVVFNDGSSGIMQELLTMCEKHKRDGGFMVPNGLRMSEYEYEVRDWDGNPTGEKKPARTFYLA